MQTRDAFGVMNAAGRVPYADGAEDEVLRALLDCVDRTDGSDELATKIHDWPTRYHFSPLRANLLRPLRLTPGMRVLEIGCGTGALSRWLGEQDVHLHAIEGNVQRARAAAVRCSGLANVEIVAGTLQDIPSDATFDLIVVVGVLEYATAFISPEDGPRLFLEALVAHLRKEGTIALAIENQLGLKYLLGYNEDHLGLPWVGVEGYARTSGPRTWSRKVLGEMLRAVGLTGQRWLFPFPDYKLPSIVIHERLYERPQGPEFIDQLVRHPVTADASDPTLLCDARLAHRQLLAGGVGPDTANSFLVVAGRALAEADAALGPELAWLFGDARRRQWRRCRAVVAASDGLHVVDRSQGSEARSLGWLTQANGSGLDRPFLPGDPLDLLVLEAIRRNDLDGVSKLLNMWRSELEAHGQPARRETYGHPFEPTPGALTFPEDYLDVLPANFILNSGSLTFVDREWVASAPVSAELVEVRALWNVAHDVVESGETHPWGSLATVDEICQALCALAGVTYTGDTFRRWRQAEAEFQHLVGGGDVTVLAGSLESMASRCTVDISPRALPFTALRASLDGARHEVESSHHVIAQLNARLHESEQQYASLQMRIEAAEQIRAEADELRTSLAEAEADLSATRREVVALTGQVREAESTATALGHEINRLRTEIKAWSDRMADIDRRLPVRLYRLARRLTGLS